MPLFVVHRRSMKNWIPGITIREQDLWVEYAAYIDRILDAGKIALGGPYMDGSGSLLIVCVKGKQEAMQLFEGDPWVAVSILDAGTVRPWQVFLNGIDKPGVRIALGGLSGEETA